MMIACVDEVLTWMRLIVQLENGVSVATPAPIATVLYMNAHIKAFTACLEEALTSETILQQYALSGSKFETLRALWRGTTPEGFSGQTCKYLQMVCFPRNCGMADLEGNFTCPGRFTVACTRATMCLSIHLTEQAEKQQRNQNKGGGLFWNKLFDYAASHRITNRVRTIPIMHAGLKSALHHERLRVITAAPEVTTADECPTDIMNGLAALLSQNPTEEQRQSGAENLILSLWGQKDTSKWSYWDAAFFENRNLTKDPSWMYGTIAAPMVWLKSGSSCQICLYYSFPFRWELQEEALTWLQDCARQLFSEVWEKASAKFKLRPHKRELIRTTSGAETDLKHCHSLRYELVGKDGRDRAFMYIGGGDYGPPHSVGVVHKGLTFERGAKLLAKWAQRSGREIPEDCIIPDPNRLHIRQDYMQTRVSSFCQVLTEATKNLSKDASGPSSSTLLGGIAAMEAIAIEDAQ